MNISLRNKLTRGIALVPVGIGSVMGTIYLTNLSKPLDLLNSLLFDKRPELKEEILTPIIPIATGGGGSGGQGVGTGSGQGGGPGTGEGPSGQGNAEEPKKEEEEESQERTEEVTQEGKEAEVEIAGTDPETIVKQVVNNITNFNLKSNLSIAALYWLLNNLKQGNLAVKQIKNIATKKINEGSNSDSGEAVSKT